MEESLPTSKLDAPQEVTVELSLLSLDKPPKLQDRESDARQEQEDRKGELKREELASFVCRRPEKRKTLHTLEAGFGVGTVPKKLVSEDATQTKLKSSKFAWKNSRFFSRTLSSVDFLKNLKRVSVSTSDENEIGIKPTEARMMKTKRNIFRKRSSSEEGPSSLEKEIREVSRTTTSIFEKFTSRRKSTQEEGIVCKREDLLSIIKPKVEVPDSVTKRIPLRHIRSATIDSSTVQQSDILPFGPNASKKRSKSKKTAFQRSLSDETRTDGESLKRETLKKKVSEEDQTIEEKKRKQSLDEKQMMNQINNKEGESDGEHATVVWDDGNVLNAMLLGDAIESFLKGSMSNDEETEKRVSFRKS